MKVPVSWLREYVDFDLPVEELAQQLVFTSCEVDRIVHRGVPGENGNWERFLVGKVLEADKHPNADKLTLCVVDVGDGEPRSIVCGAPNVAAGQTVPVVLPGGVMPEGFTIEERKLRGEVSHGMILSERELELGQDHSGIIVLADGPAPGTPLADVLPLGDDVLEIETGYNRPDLTSIYGIAREVHALTGAPLAPPPGSQPERTGDEAPEIEVEDLEGCPRYIGRLFRDVVVGPSPAWLKARLLGAGMRPISNVVDVTNYVMLALGNPLHAFDFDKLGGGRIVVRRARKGETLRTLDGTLRELDPGDLVIADAENAVALAGIMGGEETEVSQQTTNVLLEAANFEPLTTLRSSERHHLRSEGSTRWEKGVDPYLAGQAAALATELIVGLAGARWTGEREVVGRLPERPVVTYRPQRATEASGLEVPEPEQHERLQRLGFEVAPPKVTVPTWRLRDVKREIDLVEEVVRFRLLDVPATLPERQEMFGWLTPEQLRRRLVEDVLVGAGLTEVYTYSLQPDDPDPNAIELPVPLSNLQRVLRTTLLRGLVGAARHNMDAGNEGVALFEVAHVYLPPGPVPEERWRLGGIVEGGFARAKGAVELLFETLHVQPDFQPSGHPFMRTPVSASVQSGWVAQLAPGELDDDWGVFELDLADLFALVPGRLLYRDVVTFPAVKEDLAFALAERVPAGELVRVVQEAAGPELREVRVFDVYRGEQLGEDRKSVALRLAFQAEDRTLTDADAAALRERIVDAVAARLGGELRA